MATDHWFLYIVRCTDGSLYTGVAENVKEEVRLMNAGRGPSYTRSRLPVFLALTEEYMNAGDAAKRAANIKKLSRREKEVLLSAIA